MGYNLQNSFVTDDNPKYPEYHSNLRSPAMHNLFLELQPDIACIIEFSPQQAVFIRDNFTNMKLIGYFSETREPIETTLGKIKRDPEHIKHIGEGIGILYDDSKVNLESVHCMILPRGSRHGRIAVVALMKLIKTEKKLMVISTHLDHLSAKSREESMALLATLITETIRNKGEVLFYGDLNLFPDQEGDKQYQKFISELNNLAYDPVVNSAIPHYGPYGTFPGHSSAPTQYLPVIDYDNWFIPQSSRLDILIISSNIIPSYTFTVNAVFDPITETIIWPRDKDYSRLLKDRMFPSDHYPILLQYNFTY
jgi:endonuclease/exonuclease/phosphatase family metal-dependent hydrolase